MGVETIDTPELVVHGLSTTSDHLKQLKKSGKLLLSPSRGKSSLPGLQSPARTLHGPFLEGAISVLPGNIDLFVQ